MISNLEEELTVLYNKKNIVHNDLQNIYNQKCLVKNVDIRRAQDESEKYWVSFKAAEYEYKQAKNSMKLYKAKYLESVKKVKDMHKKKNKIARKEIKIEKKYNKLNHKYITVQNKIYDYKQNEEIKKYDLEDKEERKKEKMSNKLWKKIQQMPQDIIFIIRDYFMTINEQNQLMSYKLKKTIFPQLTKRLSIHIDSAYLKLTHFLYYIATDSAILSVLPKEDAINQIPSNYNKTALPYSYYVEYYFKHPRIFKNTIRILLHMLIKGRPTVANQIMKLYIIFAQEKYKIMHDYSYLVYRHLTVEDLPLEYNN